MTTTPPSDWTNTLLPRYRGSPSKILRRRSGTMMLHSSRDTDAPTIVEPRRKWLTITTDDVDRAGDVLVTSGCDLEHFLVNPQFLWQHALTSEPIHTIGRILDVRIEAHAIFALAEYAPLGVSPLADLVCEMDRAGLLPANSIGFTPTEWEENAHGGLTFTKWELVECSKVELPMNPFAIDRGQSSALRTISLEDAVQYLD